MASVLEDLQRPGRVAVLRLRSLGDCVLTTPALALLKRSFPHLQVGVMVEPHFQAVFEGNPDVHQILPPSLTALRHFRPQLCLNLHGGTRSAWLTALSGAPLRAGFAHFRHQVAYNIHIPRAQEILQVDRTVHTAEHLASAMFYLGVPKGEIPRARLSVSPSPAPASLAVLHPVAAMPEKTWPAAGFLAVAEHLRQSGLEPVFIGAAADDLSPFRNFRVLQGQPLSEIASLFASAAVFIGNDSGPAHMAAALGVPSVVIFGSSNPAVWRPWQTASEVITADGSIAEVPVDRVFDALARLRVAA